MKNTMEKTKKKKLITGKVMILYIVVSALVACVPQPKLDWEGYVLPQANQFMQNHFQETFLRSSSNDWDVSASCNITTITNATTNTTSLMSTRPLRGINVVISGATSGLGLGLTKAMLKLGAHVIAIGRNSNKLLQLQEKYGHYGICTFGQGSSKSNSSSSCCISTVIADYGDLDSVARAADNILSSFEQIDILINNAGIHELGDLFSKNKGAQGYDLVFTVNFLSHFLLTERLLPHMKNSRRPTIMQMSSSFHWGGNWADLVPSSVSPEVPIGNSADTISSSDGGGGDSNSSYSSNSSSNSGGYLQQPIASIPGGAIPFPILFRTTRGYSNSKLAQIFYARTLHRKHGLDQQHFRIVSVCPSWVDTQIMPGDNAPNTFSFFDRFAYEYDGFGIQSSLQAIFSTAAMDNDNINYDYYVNTVTYHLFSWMSKYIPSGFGQWSFVVFSIRDLFVYFYSWMTLTSQKLLPMVDVAQPNPITSNTQIQDLLYDWSKQAVMEWL